jgi:hypothetical protein
MKDFHLTESGRKLLFLVGRFPLDGISREEVEGILDKSISWEDFLKASLKHNLAPLIYCNLKKLELCEALPSYTIDVLKGAYFSSVARNILFYKELYQIIQILESKKIDVVVLKGAALARDIYKNVALRPFGDVDLLIKADRVEEACQCLEDLGYKKNFNREFNVLFGYDFPFIKFFAHQSLPVELHWNVINLDLTTFSFDVDEIWREGKVEIRMNGTKMYVMKPEYCLVHLAIHLSSVKHHFEKLIWLNDISALCYRYKKDFDWNLVVDIASRFQAKTCTYISLLLANNLFSATVPLQTLERLRPPSLIDFSLRSILTEEHLVNGLSNQQKRALKYLLPDNFKGRLKLVTNRLLKFKDFEKNKEEMKKNAGR